MPISSGAAKWTRAARNNKTNLKRSPDWPDVAQSSASLASSIPEPEQQVKRSLVTKKPTRVGSSATGCTSNDFPDSASREHSTSKTIAASRPIRSLSTEQKQQEAISIADKRTGAQAVQTREESANRLRKIMNSLGGQRVITGTSASAIDKKDAPNSTAAEQSGAKQMSLISTLVLGGHGGGLATTPTANDDYNRPRLLASGPDDASKTYSLSGHKSALNYHLAGQHKQPQRQQQSSRKTNLEGSQASLLNNPSMSFQANAGASSSNSSSSLANLHNLHNQHAHAARGSPLNISRRLNLKYVKSLIILLMSLDLLITLFVYHFSSNDELSIAFTGHRLRFSLLNLILSSIWFVVLAGAIIFDIYPILLLGCLVDFASFLLLLVCSFIHFTHRIDYNTVNLTSLLLLLFSIIVLHVYLLVIAALTTYLMLAVKRRRKIHS